MSDPPRWQINQPPYPPPSLPFTASTQLFDQQQQHQQQQQRQLPQQQRQLPQQQQSPPQQQSLPQQPSLPQLRPLQPSPFQTTLYTKYPYPENSKQNVQLEDFDSDKPDNRRTRISRAW